MGRSQRFPLGGIRLSELPVQETQSGLAIVKSAALSILVVTTPAGLSSSDHCGDWDNGCCQGLRLLTPKQTIASAPRLRRTGLHQDHRQWLKRLHESLPMPENRGMAGSRPGPLVDEIRHGRSARITATCSASSVSASTRRGRLEFVGGAVGEMTATFSAVHGPGEHSITVLATVASFRWPSVTGQSSASVGSTAPRRVQGAGDLRGPLRRFCAARNHSARGDGFRGMWQDYVHAIRNGSASRATAEDGRKAIEIMLALISRPKPRASSRCRSRSRARARRSRV